MPYYRGEPITRGPVEICAPDVAGYLEARSTADVDLSEWYDRAGAEDNIIYFGVLVSETQLPIGEVLLHDIERNAGTARIHAHVFQAQRRLLGHGCHALKAVVEYAFKHEKLKGLTLVINEENFPARRCYAKCGFQQVDRSDDDRSQLIMSLTRDEWRRMVDDDEW